LLTSFRVAGETLMVKVDDPSPTQTILVVEDDPEVLTMMVRILELEGFRVLDASDGVAALEVLKKAPKIDLLVTDIVMPGLDGLGLASHVAAASNTPVLFVSGYGQARGQVPGPFLRKPFTPSELAAAVRKVLLLSSGSPKRQ